MNEYTACGFNPIGMFKKSVVLYYWEYWQTRDLLSRFDLYIYHAA